MDPLLTRIVLADNPWFEHPDSWETSVRARLPEVYISRTAEQQLLGEAFDSQQAFVVVGPRQTGKSTLLWHALYARELRPLFINCEEKAVQQACRSAAAFLQDFRGLLDVADLLFLDEVQHLDEAGLFVKGTVDRRVGLPILVTGSASFHLRSRTRESLAGRAARCTLLPLSLAEISTQWLDAPGPVRELRANEAWQRQTVFGGYPQVWLSDNQPTLLSRLVDAFLMRDASDLFRIGRPDAFRKLTRLAAGQIGNLVNYAEYASICGISSDTVAAYLGILEESHVVRLLSPFTGGKRAELTRRPKLYFVDCGLRNAVLGAFGDWQSRPDRGPLLENWVFAELLKAMPPHAELHYWQSKSRAEVDFVVDVGDGTVAIETKAAALGKPRLSRSARSFIEAYGPRCMVVVNTGLQATQRLGHTTLQWIMPYQLVETVFRHD